jgi:hypothetical protein
MDDIVMLQATLFHITKGNFEFIKCGWVKKFTDRAEFGMNPYGNPKL